MDKNDHKETDVSCGRVQIDICWGLQSAAHEAHIFNGHLSGGQHTQKGIAIMETKIVDLGKASRETQGAFPGSPDNGAAHPLTTQPIPLG